VAQLFAVLLTLAFAVAAARAEPAPNGACETRVFDTHEYVVCEAPAGADLRLFFANPEGQPFGTFTAIEEALDARGERLVFAMNGGMYTPNFAPAGLYVERGIQRRSANQRSGAGNFHMKPNGVFWIDKDGKTGVTETGAFVREKLTPAYATQSGPLLVIDGRLHPRIRENGTSRKIRNGVGVCAEGRTKFVISNAPVTFHEFATVFQRDLACPNALYLDGSISALYAPDLGRHDRWRPMGPVVGLVAAKK